MRSSRMGSGSSITTTAAAVALALATTALIVPTLATPARAASPQDTAEQAPTQKARPARRMGPLDLGQVLDRHAQELGLDDATLAKIDAISTEAQPETKKLRDKLQSEHRAMRDLLSADQPDVKAVMKQADVIGATETELSKQRLRTMLAIRELLTPEQRAQLMQLQQGQRGNMRGPKAGGPPPH